MKELTANIDHAANRLRIRSQRNREGEPTGINEEGTSEEGDKDAPEAVMLAKTLRTKETLEAVL